MVAKWGGGGGGGGGGRIKYSAITLFFVLSL